MVKFVSQQPVNTISPHNLNSDQMYGVVLKLKTLKKPKAMVWGKKL